MLSYSDIRTILIVNSPAILLVAALISYPLYLLVVLLVKKCREGPSLLEILKMVWALCVLCLGIVGAYVEKLWKGISYIVVNFGLDIPALGFSAGNSSVIAKYSKRPYDHATIDCLLILASGTFFSLACLLHHIYCRWNRFRTNLWVDLVFASVALYFDSVSYIGAWLDIWLSGWSEGARTSVWLGSFSCLWSAMNFVLAVMRVRRRRGAFQVEEVAMTTFSGE
jgi:hypothetical protein